MMSKVVIKLNTDRYLSPTQEDIDEGKAYIRKRNEYALALAALIDGIISDVAEKVMRICYQYNVEAERFTLESDGALFGEIQGLMNEAEDEIASLIESYSVTCADDKPDRKLLALYLSSLGRANKSFASTLHEYMKRFLYDLEAMAAAYRMASLSLTAALTKMKGALHNVYQQKEVVSAYRKPSVAAMYLQTKGVHFDFETGRGTVGLSNNGATNLTSLARNALTMVWMRYQAMMYQRSGAVGYYQLRGSAFPCAICDSQVGFHEGVDRLINDPYPHVNCICYRIPIYDIKDLEQLM